MPTATLTSKGQLTLPKAIREQVGAQTGDRLDVSVSEDGTIHLRRMGGTIRELGGILRRPGQRPVSIREMDESIAEFLAADDERIRSGR